MNTEYVLLGAVIIVGLVLLSALAVAYHKLSKAAERLRAELPVATGNVIQQVESWLAIQQELQLRHPLPPTRGWAASPDFLRAVMTHAMATAPKTVVECSSGISTLVLARCVQRAGHGHVHSLEHDREFADKTREMLTAEGLQDFATVYDAPLSPLELPGWKGNWYTHTVLPTALEIDLLVIDGPPWFVGPLPRYPAVPVLHTRMRSGSFVFLDDADRSEERQIVSRWLSDFKDLESQGAPRCEKGCAILRRVP